MRRGAQFAAYAVFMMLFGGSLVGAAAADHGGCHSLWCADHTPLELVFWLAGAAPVLADALVDESLRAASLAGASCARGLDHSVDGTSASASVEASCALAPPEETVAAWQERVLSRLP